MKILLVEDDESNAILFKHELEDEGEYQITVTADGKTAMKIFGIDSFDLVILDLVLPGANGDQLAKEMKLLHPEIPIIIHTGLDRDVGFVIPEADKYVTKTTGCERLKEIVKEYSLRGT